jgi:hypothetical protein
MMRPDVFQDVRLMCDLYQTRKLKLPLCIYDMECFAISDIVPIEITAISPG